jgi:hypothetical protein
MSRPLATSVCHPCLALVGLVSILLCNPCAAEETHFPEQVADAVVGWKAGLETPPRIVRVSIATDGGEPNGPSHHPSLSGNGRFVVFTSYASNLVPGDSGGEPDVFWHDRDADGNGIFDEAGGVLTGRASVGMEGAEANGASFEPVISDDGRHVAFTSAASNLVSGDSNGRQDVFVRDLQSGSTRLVSRGLGGAPANGDSATPAISADGRRVVFASLATNLVLDDTNGLADVFLHIQDIGVPSVGGGMQLVSVAADGTPANGASFQPSISAFRRAGRDHAIAFVSEATNLAAFNRVGVAVFIRDGAAGSIYQTCAYEPFPRKPQVSATGRFLTCASQNTSGVDRTESSPIDIFYEMVDKPGFHAVLSHGGGPTDTSRTPGNGDAESGQRQHSRGVFVSAASNLLPAASTGRQVYVRDFGDAFFNGTYTRRITMAADASAANGGSSDPVLSSNLQYVAFRSDASNLVAGDTNGHGDIFVADIDSGWPAGHANLVVTVEGLEKTLKPDSPILVNVRVRNLGPATAENVRTRMKLYFDFTGYPIQIPDDAGGGIYPAFSPDPLPAGCNLSSGITCSAGSMPAGTERTYSIRIGLAIPTTGMNFLQIYRFDASAVTSSPDWYIGNNEVIDEFLTSNCSGLDKCVLEHLYCENHLAKRHPLADVSAKASVMAGFVPDLALYYRVRDELMQQRAEGQRLTALYETHSAAILERLLLDGELSTAALAALQAWEPTLRVAVEGLPLDRYAVGQPEIDAVNRFLDLLRAGAEPPLADAIDSERQRLPDDLLLGRTLGEVFDTAMGRPFAVIRDGFEVP